MTQVPLNLDSLSLPPPVVLNRRPWPRNDGVGHRGGAGAHRGVRARLLHHRYFRRPNPVRAIGGFQWSRPLECPSIGRRRWLRGQRGRMNLFTPGVDEVHADGASVPMGRGSLLPEPAYFALEFAGAGFGLLGAGELVLVGEDGFLRRRVDPE